MEEKTGLNSNFITDFIDEDLANGVNSRIQTRFQRFLRHVHQLFHIRRHRIIPHIYCAGCISDSAFIFHAHIHADNIAFLQNAVLVRNAVYDFLIDRYARAGGESAVPQKGGDHARAPDGLLNEGVDVGCGDPGPDDVLKFLQDEPRHLA